MPLNVKDFILTESKLLILLWWSSMEISSSSGSHASIWASGVLILFVPGPLSSGIPVWNGSAYHTCCMFYQMPGTASACVLHYSIWGFLLCALFSALWITVCYLSQYAYSFMSFMLSNVFFSALCAYILWSHISTCPLSISSVFFWDISSFMISCMLLHCLYSLWIVLWIFYCILYSYILQLLFALCTSSSVWSHYLFYVICNIVITVLFCCAAAWIFPLAHLSVLLNFACIFLSLSKSLYEL